MERLGIFLSYTFVRAFTTARLKESDGQMSYRQDIRHPSPLSFWDAVELLSLVDSTSSGRSFFLRASETLATFRRFSWDCRQEFTQRLKAKIPTTNGSPLCIANNTRNQVCASVTRRAYLKPCPFELRFLPVVDFKTFHKWAHETRALASTTRVVQRDLKRSVCRRQQTNSCGTNTNVHPLAEGTDGVLLIKHTTCVTFARFPPGVPNVMPH